VTLGLIADLYEPETQHWPLCFIVLSSTIGTSIGGVIGGPIERCKSNLVASQTLMLTMICRFDLAVELLDPTHLWCRCPGYPLLHA
jgi:hypothetical protein